MSIKEFLESGMDIVDRTDRFLYSGSLLDSCLEERKKSGKCIEAVRRKCEQFIEGVPSFGEWLKLTDKAEWENEIRKIYEDQNGY
jgi:hypothetical protein